MSESLIRQAIRELHIDIEPHNREFSITPVLEPKDSVGWTNADRTETTAYMVMGKDRKGNELSLKIDANTVYPQIVEAIKTAWRG